MIPLKGKERVDAINALKKAAVKDFELSEEQASKRVDALVLAIDNGMFEGIPETGPADFLQAMFVEVKTKQIMQTPIE